MAKKQVLFVQGAGAGAHAEDALLVASLRRALGSDYTVHYPQMPEEAAPSLASWSESLAAVLSGLTGEIMLVGHSIGGATLLKYLSEADLAKPIAGLFLLAAPAWEPQDWNFDELKLPPQLAEKLGAIARVFLYHSEDDQIVPFAHLALHAAQLPQATLRPLNGRGHQFGNDLTDLARDICSDTP